jgi:hypothetical protein
LFKRKIENSLEIISVLVVNLSLAFDMVCEPVSLNFCSVCKEYGPWPMFLSIHEITPINSSIAEEVRPISVSLTSDPLAFVTISVRVEHFSFSMLEIIEPRAFINVSIGIIVCTFALLSLLNCTLETIPILEDIGSFDDRVLSPHSEVYVTIVIYIYS